jgi:hypothetical protein
VELLPGSHDLASGRQLSDTLEYRYLVAARTAGTSPTEAGAGRVETRATTYQGTPALMIVLGFSGRNSLFRDTTIVEIDGLAPRYESHHSNDRHTRYEYEGTQVRRTVLAPDSAAGRSVHRYDVPVFHFNELTAIVRSIPLRHGYEAIVPLYSQGDDALERDTIQVIGRDSLGVWNVRFADRVIAGTYGIDGTTRRIVRYDVVPQKRTGHATWKIDR